MPAGKWLERFIYLEAVAVRRWAHVQVARSL